MILINIISTFFLTSLLTAGLLLLLLPNPIHSLILLVLIFINAAGILMIFNFDFIALLLIIIYVGALAILFLFILMMLDLNLTSIFKTDWFVFLIFSCLMILLISLTTLDSTFNFLVNTLKDLNLNISIEPWINYITEINNCATFGQILFSYYLFFFLVAGLILLLALISAVRLTYIAQTNRTQTHIQLSKTFYIGLIK